MLNVSLELFRNTSQKLQLTASCSPKIRELNLGKAPSLTAVDQEIELRLKANIEYTGNTPVDVSRRFMHVQWCE